MKLKITSNGTVDTPVKHPDTGVYKEARTDYNSIAGVEVDIAVEPYPKSRYMWVELFAQNERLQEGSVVRHCRRPLLAFHRQAPRVFQRQSASCTDAKGA